jgi:hypothetical protein
MDEVRVPLCLSCKYHSKEDHPSGVNDVCRDPKINSPMMLYVFPVMCPSYKEQEVRNEQEAIPWR